MYRLSGLITKKRIIVITVIAAIITTGWYLVFHGSLRIEDSIANPEVKYWRINNTLQKNLSGIKKGNLIGFSSGTYGIQIPMKSGGMYWAHVDIPYFMGTTSITSPDFEALITPLGRRVSRSIIVGNSGLLSWDTTGNVHSINSAKIDSNVETDTPLKIDNLTKISQYQGATQLSKELIVGLLKTSNTYRPVVYNAKNNTQIQYPTLDKSNRAVLQAESTGFSIYRKEASTVSFYQEDSPNVVHKKIHQSDQLSLHDGLPIYSFQGNVNRLAIITGPNTYSGGDIPENDQKKKPKQTFTKLSVFNTKDDSQTSDLNLGTANVTYLSISPNGKYIAVVTNQSIGIYNVDDLSRVTSFPLTTTDRLFWIKNDDIILNASERGIIKISLTRKTAVSLVPYDMIRPTKLSFVEGDNLYLTGFSSLNDGNNKPDAYRVLLSENTASNQRKILRAFPHQGDGFYVDRLNGITTVQLSRYISSDGTMVSEKAKQAGVAYAKRYIGDKGSVHFSYITTDLRTRPDNDE